MGFRNTAVSYTHLFDVIDLGKDVDPEIIVDTAIKEKVKLVPSISTYAPLSSKKDAATSKCTAEAADSAPKNSPLPWCVPSIKTSKQKSRKIISPLAFTT